jgi:hypothetical protein
MIQLTLAFAMFYSLIMFPAILSSFGPQGHFGDLVQLIILPIKRRRYYR